LLSEPDIAELITPGILLPRVAGDRLVIHRFEGSDSLRKSTFGMLEPDPEICPLIDEQTIELAIIPGVAFDPTTGARLGRGGGFYDRLLSAPGFRATRIGAAFDLQLVDGLPTEPHDQRVDYIVTESGITPTPEA